MAFGTFRSSARVLAGLLAATLLHAHLALAEQPPKIPPSLPLEFNLGRDQSAGALNDDALISQPWRESYSTIGADLKGILSYPLDHPRATRNALLGIGLLVLADRPVTNAYQNHVEKALDGFSLPALPWQSGFDKLELVKEDGWLLSSIGTTYIYGAIAKDDRAKRAALLSTKALAYSMLTSQIVLKSLTGRHRPHPDLDNPVAGSGYTDDPLDFGNFHGISVASNSYGTSMPSYHFTQYFAVARVYSGIYDNSWVPYGIAGVLAASDVKGHHHWVSDMVAGSLIGIAIGNVILDTNTQYRKRGYAVNSYPTRDGVGVMFQTKF